MNKIPKLRFPEFSGEWEEKNLDEIGQIIAGGTPSTTNEEYWEGDINWFTPTEIGKNKYLRESKRKITNLGLKNSSAKILPEGTILLTSRATIGDMGILLKESTTNQGFQSILVNNNNCNEFIYYLGNNIKTSMLEKASGSTFLEISGKEVKKINISIPQLPEQKKIASFLSEIDKSIEILEQEKELWEQYKKGMMQKIFSQKIRFKDENGNDYLEWEIKSIDKISEISMGFTPDTKDSEMWNGNYKWLSIADMKKNRKYISYTSKFISDKGKKNRRILTKGTLIMSFKLTLGRVGILQDEMFTNEAICNFDWKVDNIITEYMYYYFNSIKIESFGSRAAMGITLNTESLNSIVVKIPVIQEQEKIADFFSFIDEKIEIIIQELENSKKLKKGLLQQMFI